MAMVHYYFTKDVLYCNTQGGGIWDYFGFRISAFGMLFGYRKNQYEKIDSTSTIPYRTGVRVPVSYRYCTCTVVYSYYRYCTVLYCTVLYCNPVNHSEAIVLYGRRKDRGEKPVIIIFFSVHEFRKMGRFSTTQQSNSNSNYYRLSYGRQFSTQNNNIMMFITTT